ERTDSQIIFTDAEGVVVYANEAIEKLTGFTSGELIGTKAGKPWGGLMDKEFYDHMWLQIKQQKKPYEGELINKKKTGETYYAHVNITPVLDARGEVEFFVGIERDITYFKELDKVKTEFISLASHQLRTPLSSIKWLCELFWQGDTSGLPADQRDIVSKVQHENERLIRLVNSLLNISRIDSKKLLFTPVLTNIAEVLNKFVTDLKPKIAEKQQTVELEIPADLPQIMLDTKLVGEAFSNLLSNANKYTPKGGRLWIKTKADSKELIISVADNGIGIPAEDWHRIFEKFFRARNATTSQMDGSGLGLYFVKWVAEQHGGRVWFESAENSGTTFYLAFPLPVKN
ncbi:MAG: PAS domain-containing sensor histidine kinase, partial [bacterium]